MSLLWTNKSALRCTQVESVTTQWADVLCCCCCSHAFLWVLWVHSLTLVHVSSTQEHRCSLCRTHTPLVSLPPSTVVVSPFLLRCVLAAFVSFSLVNFHQVNDDEWFVDPFIICWKLEFYVICPLITLIICHIWIYSTANPKNISDSKVEYLEDSPLFQQYLSQQQCHH